MYANTCRDFPRPAAAKPPSRAPLAIIIRKLHAAFPHSTQSIIITSKHESPLFVLKEMTLLLLFKLIVKQTEGLIDY